MPAAAAPAIHSRVRGAVRAPLTASPPATPHHAPLAGARVRDGGGPGVVAQRRVQLAGSREGEDEGEGEGQGQGERARRHGVGGTA